MQIIYAYPCRSKTKSSKQVLSAILFTGGQEIKVTAYFHESWIDYVNQILTFIIAVIKKQKQ